MISTDIQEIQKTKKVENSGIRSKLRKIVWVITILAAILAVSIGQSVDGYFAAAVLSTIFHILAKYIDASLLTVDLAITLSIGYFLAFFTFILIPVDTALAIKNENIYKEQPLSQVIVDLSTTENKQLYDNSYYKLWKVVYWVMMAINMLVMNIQNLFHKTGHIFFCSRIIGTIVSYIKLCLVFVIPYVIGCIGIFIFTRDFGIGVMTQVFLLLSNIYGITVLVLLIGYGLVQYPYSLWSKTNRNNTLDILLSKAEPLYNRYCDAQTTVLLASQKMQKIISKIYDGHQLFEFKNMLINEIPNLDEYRSYKTSSSSSNLAKHVDDLPDIITEDVVAQARFQLKSAKYNFVKVFNKWKQHCDQVYKIIEMDSLNSKKTLSSPKKIEKSQNNSKKQSALASKFLTTTFNDLLKDYKQLEAIEMDIKYVIFYRIMAVIAGIFSVLIIYSETALIFSTNNNQAIVFMRIVKDSTNVGGLVFFILLVLGYIIYCSCFALFEIDLGAGFEIYPYHTHPLTMMFNSKTCGTIAFPLCYNVMLIFNQVNNDNLTVHSGFDVFFKPMQSVPFFGSWYNLIVCMLISVVGILSLFSSLKKLVKMISRDAIDMGTNEIALEKIQQGEKWVINEWERRKKMQFIKNLSNRDSHIDQSDEESAPPKKEGFLDKVKSVFSSNKKSEKNNQAQAAQEMSLTNQQLNQPSKLAQLINKKKQNQNGLDGRKEKLEEGGMIARVKYQQQLQQQENEMSLEDMVNRKAQKQYNNEISLDDSFYDTKSSIVNSNMLDDAKNQIPSFQVIHVNNLDGQDNHNQGNSQVRNTLPLQSMLNEFYTNNKFQANQINSNSHTDSSQFDLTYSDQSSQIRSKKNAVVLPNHNETNPNSNRSIDSYSHEFEVNVNGNNVKHKMFSQQQNLITEEFEEYQQNQTEGQQINQRKRVKPNLYATQINDSPPNQKDNEENHYHNNDQSEMETQQVNSYQIESYGGGFASVVKDRIMNYQNDDEVEDNEIHKQDEQRREQQQNYNLEQTLDEIDRYKSDSISGQNPNLQYNDDNDNQVTQNRQSNVSNVSQKSLKLNLSGIKASIDDDSKANYDNMNQKGELEFQKDRKKKQKIKKIHQKMLEQGKDIPENYDVDSDVYDEDDEQQEHKQAKQQDTEHYSQNKHNKTTKEEDKKKKPQNNKEVESDNSDELEYQMTRGRSTVTQPQQARQSLINADGGWVYKKSENKMMRKLKGWTKKFIVVKEDKLIYYEGDNLQKKGNDILMQDIVNVVQYNKDARKANKKEADNDRDLRFIIYTKSRQFDFKTENEQETVEWVDHIQNSVLRYLKNNKKSKN